PRSSAEERRTSNPRAEVRLLPGPSAPFGQVELKLESGTVEVIRVGGVVHCGKRLAAAVAPAKVFGALLGGTGQAGGRGRPHARPVVPSLAPQPTQREWRRLVRRRRLFAASPGCRPLRAVFYAPTDWLRLATKLAANPSPCAQYYISIPPMSGSKTT